jgi:hypothetical protein
MQMRQVLLNRLCRFLTDMLRFMRSFSLFQSSKERNQMMRDLLEPILPQLLRSTSQLVEEVSRVQLPINLVKTLLKCSRSISRMQINRKSKSGRHLGDSVQDQLVL